MRARDPHTEMETHTDMDTRRNIQEIDSHKEMGCSATEEEDKEIETERDKHVWSRDCKENERNRKKQPKK